MNEKLNKIKLFFKKKPVKITLAILVIAAIMTGIAFAIMAFSKNISKKNTDPDDHCSDESGTTWDPNLQTCVKDSCDDINGKEGIVCKAQGKINNCIPKDYCNYRGPDKIKYSYDEDTCMCKLDCSSKYGENNNKSFTTDGRTRIDMKYNPSISSYEPIDGMPLFCGYPCDFNTKEYSIGGGNKWCKQNFKLCGQQLDKDGNNMSEKGQGCFNDEYYAQCSDSDIVCKLDDIQGQESRCIIVSDSEAERFGKYACTRKICEGSNKEGKDLIYACVNDKDCLLSGTTLPEPPTCLKGSADKDQKFKYYKTVGYCSATNRGDHEAWCTTADMLGENKNDPSEPAICDKLDYSNLYPNKKGISAFNNPCDDNTFGNHGCAKYGICDNNNWQALFKDMSDHTCRSSAEPPENPEKDFTLCCSNSHTATLPGVDPIKYCCPISTPESGPAKGECSLNTKYGYSKRVLTGDTSLELSETIPCTSDAKCITFNDNLWHNLGHTGTNPANFDSDPEAATMYCDIPTGETTGVCKAVCGLFDSPGKLKSVYGLLNNGDSGREHSYCYSKEGCQVSDLSWGGFSWNEINYPPAEQGLPICIAQGHNPKWTGPRGPGYLTVGKAKTAKADGTPCDNPETEQSCLQALGKSGYQIRNIEVVPGGCNILQPCGQLDVTWEHDKQIGSIPWTSLKESPEFNKTNFPNVTIAQSPLASLNEPDRPRIFYDRNNKCKGDTNDLNVSLTKPPLRYVSATEACTPTELNFLKLTNEGDFCEHGINPIENDCLPKPTAIENFSNVDSDSEKIYINVDNIKSVKPSVIQDSDANRYYCGYMDLVNDGQVDTKKLVEDGDADTSYLICNDGPFASHVKCVDDDGYKKYCCRKKLGNDHGKIIYEGGKYKCVDFPQSDSQYCDPHTHECYYLCTDKDTDTVSYKENQYKRAKFLTTGQYVDDPSILFKGTTNPAICDLRNETVWMDGCWQNHWWTTTHCNNSGTTNLCNLVNLPNGCADLDHNLKADNVPNWKSGTGECMLQHIRVPAGVEATIFEIPSGTWCEQKDMCSIAKNCVTGVTEYIHFNKSSEKKSDDIKKKTCSIKFDLDKTINPYACGLSAPEPSSI